MITIAADLPADTPLVRHGHAIHIIIDVHDMPTLVRTACGRDVIANRSLTPTSAPGITICPDCTNAARSG